MTRIRQLQLACILLAGGGLVLAYSLNGLWQWSWIFIVLSLFWRYGQRRLWQSVPSVGMTGFILSAVVGIWLGLKPLSMLLITAIALSAWDLSNFEQRLRQKKQDQSTQRLLNRHLKKLSVVVALGVFVAGIAMSLQMKLNFWIVFLLGLILALSLSRAFLLMKNEAGKGQLSDQLV